MVEAVNQVDSLVGREFSFKMEEDIEAIVVVLVICETHCEAFANSGDILPLYKHRGDGGDWKDEEYPLIQEIVRRSAIRPLLPLGLADEGDRCRSVTGHSPRS